MFIDVAKIRIKAGDGGNGKVSFHREKYVATGGPDGGDGGKGGSVIFVVDDNMSTLLDFKYKTKYEAENGQGGGGARCSGKDGKDLTIRVPRGTIIKDAETGRIIKDMSENEPFVCLKGGRGGWGNSHFATPTRQVPRFAKAGIEGDTLEIVLELKLLADVGLVGFPNVGKSTLLSIVSAAKPKIANYHFTTLIPQLGVVKVGETSFVMADIPGLIEGAKEGIGLGHDFLRHIERCRLFVHIVDISGIEGRDPIEDFETINNELFAFNPELANRTMLVCANKCDISTENLDKFKEYTENKGYRFFAISAATRQGVDTLINTVAAELAKLPPVVTYEPEQLIEIDERKADDTTITIEDGVFVIEGKWLKRLLNSISTDEYESMQYLHKVLKRAGIIDRLESMGISDGDTVVIYDAEFDYIR